MTPKRFSYTLIGLLVILAGASVALTYFADQWLTVKAQELVTLKLDTAALEEKQRVNKKSEAELEKYKDVAEELEKIVPKSKDQANAIAEILQIGKELGVEINSITFPASTLGQQAAGSVTTGTTAATTPAPGSSSVSQAAIIPEIPGVLGIEVTLASFRDTTGQVDSNITYSQVTRFLEAVERNRRTMQIKNLSITPLASDGETSYALSITMNIFVKP